ncbi:SOS-induced cell division inhibitor SulA [Ectopseudomonas guguanensis]|uniref:SOS-induced cell division inhibitor SulA n=1 Tax=Ectopseudomonas guguanensis TaxID=1198456 RepID=UPI0012D5215C|nr:MULTISPECIES: SOS-induced cell division inhibitor SulA [Pseudomonas]MPT18208.1 CDP-glycerol--UDP-pyrophosphoryl-N-acetylglucosaminyl-N-acetylmannosamine glycerophosphotransferase [Pseudomonas sp.]WJH56240.1 CDP-glycerol--UDP-pyrophosphoryl-N-acetylglucosaminyl-N-acetylmannosamine glycerophosphotransferase [Pseudomonas guguanensis]
MQVQQSFERPQLPLFDAFLGASGTPLVTDDVARSEDDQAFSELALRGAAGHCLHLLAPILRELSQNQDARWLTLVAPPASLTQAWLRDAGLNRERILLLHPRQGQSALELAEEALKLGRSHTVISWLHPVERSTRQRLAQAAASGGAQSLNISLG